MIEEETVELNQSEGMDEELLNLIKNMERVKSYEGTFFTTPTVVKVLEAKFDVKPVHGTQNLSVFLDIKIQTREGNMTHVFFGGCFLNGKRGNFPDHSPLGRARLAISRIEKKPIRFDQIPKFLLGKQIQLQSEKKEKDDRTIVNHYILMIKGGEDNGH